MSGIGHQTRGLRRMIFIFLLSFVTGVRTLPWSGSKLARNSVEHGEL
jgi:hypothetical protein